MLAAYVLIALVAQQSAPASRTASQSGSRPGVRPLVATHYFYWYRWPGEHFGEPGAPGPEGHRHHFEQPQRVSYLDPAWHEAQFAAMADCGIAAALPVYWGAPGAYERANLRFSRDGLVPMVAALDRLAAAGRAAPKLGLFYDTSTLLDDVRGVEPRGARADLRTPAGKELFCRTVTDFFAAIPPALWARHAGRPLVVLYASGFAAGWDRTLGDELRRAFGAAFAGERPFLVADVSWGEIGQDRTTAWGAALSGARLFPGVAQIGPGYDDSPVPGRRTPIREREDGAFYRASWNAALQHRPELVLVETWNEMHEGTEICATRETGTLYLDITRACVARLLAGSGPGPAVELAHPRPRPRADLSWGQEAAGLAQVSADYTGTTTKRVGLRELTWEDGRVSVAAGALRCLPLRDGGRYVYFQISDHWQFDGGPAVSIDVYTERNGGCSALEYDAAAESGPHAGAYTRVVARSMSFGKGPGPEDGRWAHFEVDAPRFANRQNGGCDFRLVIDGDPCRILAVRVSRLGPATRPGGR